MLKKITVCIGVILLTATLAPAQSGQTASTDTTGATLLGVVEGAMNFCSKVSPGTPSGYKTIDQLILQGQSEKTVDQIRESNAYATSLNQTKKLLQGLSPADASAVCSTH